MGRLSGLLGKALDAQAGLETAVEKDVAKYIERVRTVHEKRERAFAGKHAELDGHVTDLSEFEKDLDVFDGKNEHSGDGSKNDAYAGTRLKD